MAANGEEALDILEKTDFDLLVLDMHMPVMNGIETAKIFRFMYPGKNHVPILMLTANATTEALQACKDAGFDGFLTKPVEPKKLLQAIDELVENRQYNNKFKGKTPFKIVSLDNPENVPLLDVQIINMISDMTKDQNFMPDLIEGYINNSRNMIEQIDSAVIRSDYETVRNLAHTLSGSSRSIGAKRLSLIADQLFKQAHPDQKEIITSHIHNLRTMFEETSGSLRSFLNGRQSAAL
jgi:two-component system sensor histidine kinase RpfC